MWKRDEGLKLTVGHATSPTPAVPLQPSLTPALPQPRARTPVGKDLASIGKSVVIKGELVANEDVTIDGEFEGKIELKDHVLTIGPNGKLKAQIFVKVLVVFGEVNGNITASDKVDILDGGSVDGDIVSPRVAIAEDVHFRGSLDMQRKPKPQPQVQDPQPPLPAAQAASKEPSAPKVAAAGTGDW